MNYAVGAFAGLVIAMTCSGSGLAKDRCSYTPASNLVAYCNIQVGGYCNPQTGYTTINGSNNQQVAAKNDACGGTRAVRDRGKGGSQSK
jgi:hypothetical protein